MTEDEALERIGTEQLFGVNEAAATIHVSPWTIRQWVNRGHLHPIPGIRPLTFFETDVYACQTLRRGTRTAIRVATLATVWKGVQ